MYLISFTKWKMDGVITVKTRQIIKCSSRAIGSIERLLIFIAISPL